MRSTERSWSSQVVAWIANPGVGRHFRVQFRAASEKDWRMFAVFRRREQAEACLGTLHAQGVTARLIDCDRCPTAL